MIRLDATGAIGDVLDVAGRLRHYPSGMTIKKLCRLLPELDEFSGFIIQVNGTVVRLEDDLVPLMDGDQVTIISAISAG